MQNTPFPRRQMLSNKVLQTYPGSVPVIVTYEKYQKKFICNRDYVMSFVYSNMKKIMNINEDMGIIFMASMLGKGYLVHGSAVVGDVYDRWKDPDGFLYITCQPESMFG